MKFIRRIFAPRVADQIDGELELHFDLYVRDCLARGMSPAEAQAAARARLGDLAAARAECLDIGHRMERRKQRLEFWSTAMQDLRFALRGVRRHKGWSAVAVGTLALGIGAVVAVFSVVSSLVLHPLPYPGADRVMLVQQRPTANGGGFLFMSSPGEAMLAWRERARLIDGIEPFAGTDRMLMVPGTEPVLLHTIMTLPTFTTFTHSRPRVGRFFVAGDVVRGAPHVALISTAMWRSRFGEDPSAIGRTITLDGDSYEIIGVMPPVAVPRPAPPVVDVWLPLVNDADGLSRANAMLRVRTGVTTAAVEHELLILQSQALAGATDERTRLLNAKKGAFSTPVVAPLQSMLTIGQSLDLLAWAGALVLLIACANVSHLLLARGLARTRELAVRTAIGAGRFRLARQMLTENVLLAVLGCGAGIALGWVGLRFIIASRPAALNELDAARLDATTVVLAVAAALGTGIVFTLVSAMQFMRRDTHDLLRSASNSSGTPGHQRMRAVLVVTELALSATLLVGAALIVRSVQRLQQVDPGFRTTNLYTAQLSLPRSRYSTQAAATFQREAIERVRALPGVQSVAIASSVPPNTGIITGTFEPDHATAPPSGMAFTKFNATEPGYFALIGQPIVDGTTFTDTSKAAGQAIINEGLAKRMWPGESAVGHRFRLAPGGDWRTIVGVASDVATSGLIADRTEAMVYFPPQDPTFWALIVRTSGVNPIGSLRGVLASLDPHLPAVAITAIDQAMRESIARPRFTMLLLSIFTGLAVLLTAVGLYGVMAYAVGARTKEIGIRMALGATRKRVALTVLRFGAALTIIGIGIGLVGARWATALLKNLLYGLPSTDAVSFVAGAAMLFIVAIIAAIVPARRAMAVDPITAIRSD